MHKRCTNAVGDVLRVCDNGTYAKHIPLGNSQAEVSQPAWAGSYYCACFRSRAGSIEVSACNTEGTEDSVLQTFLRLPWMLA